VFTGSCDAAAAPVAAARPLFRRRRALMKYALVRIDAATAATPSSRPAAQPDG